MKSFVVFSAILACALSHAPAPAPGYYGSHGYGAGPGYAGAYAHVPAHIIVLPSGYLADTPEVAHAKGAHSVAKAHVAAAAAANPDYTSPPHGAAGAYGYAAPAYAGSGYAAPAAYSGLGYASGPAYSGAHAGGPYAGSYAYAPAHVTVLSNGHIADTPEVAHAKGAHYAAKAQAAAAAAASPDYSSHGYSHAGYAAPAHYGYSGHY